MHQVLSADWLPCFLICCLLRLASIQSVCFQTEMHVTFELSILTSSQLTLYLARQCQGYGVCKFCVVFAIKPTTCTSWMWLSLFVFCFVLLSSYSGSRPLANGPTCIGDLLIRPRHQGRCFRSESLCSGLNCRLFGTMLAPLRLLRARNRRKGLFLIHSRVHYFSFRLSSN